MGIEEKMDAAIITEGIQSLYGENNKITDGEYDVYGANGIIGKYNDFGLFLNYNVKE